MPRLLSVNVGLPRDVTWNGKTVRTAVWKSPVTGRRMVRKLEIDGDAQADLAGHGGEHRAVYQMDAYHSAWDRRFSSLQRCSACALFSYVLSVILTKERSLRFQLSQDKSKTRTRRKLATWRTERTHTLRGRFLRCSRLPNVMVSCAEKNHWGDRPARCLHRAP
jgi:hypothetical protein